MLTNTFSISHRSTGVAFTRVGAWWIHTPRGCRACRCLSTFIHVYVTVGTIPSSLTETRAVDWVARDWFFSVASTLLTTVISICPNRTVWSKKLETKNWMHCRDNAGNFNQQRRKNKEIVQVSNTCKDNTSTCSLVFIYKFSDLTRASITFTWAFFSTCMTTRVWSTIIFVYEKISSLIHECKWCNNSLKCSRI